MNNLKSCFLKMTFACLFMAFTMYAQKPQLKGDDLVCNGESFFEYSDICSELSKLAREDGVLPANESFKQVAKAGQGISVIKGLYTGCNPKPKYLVSDGGGIDLFGPNCQPGDKNCSKIQEIKKILQDYIAEMVKYDLKALLWMGYPEAPGYGQLTTNQAIWTEVTKELIAQTTEPKAIYVDLLPVFAGHYNEYFPAGDGLHPTNAGSKAAAKAFWDAMKANNYAFFDTLPPVSVPKQSVNNSRGVSGQILSQVMKNGNLSVSLSVDQPSDIRVKLTTVSGRSVFTSQKHTTVCGKQDVVFPTGKLASGIYCCEIKTGTMINQSTLLVP